MNSGGTGRRLIDGRFELLGRLGSGGMGTVWRARDIALQRDVALKEVRPPDPASADTDPAASHTLHERVLREARALARLAHPNVVTVHHIVESPEGAHPWIVMELVAGQSLHDRLQQGPLSVPEALRIGQGVLSALRAAHAAGIHHRDVKPANVLLRPDGSPVLTDFGIAALRETTRLTATGELIGSPEYIAPERIRGDEGNPASDLWSLGMLLYVALEGTHPLRRATNMATLVAVLDEPVPPPVRSGPLAPLLTALLVRDTSARPNAEQLERMFAEAGRAAASAPPGAQTPPHALPPFPPPPVSSSPSPSVSPGMAGVLQPSDRPGSAPPGFGPPPRFPERRRGPWTTVAVTLVAVAAAATMAVFVPGLLRSDAQSDTGHDARTPSTGGVAGGTATPVASGTPDVSPSTPAASVNLLTPNGARTAVAALRGVTGGSKVITMTVYPQYVIAEAPAQTDPAHLYDNFQYRDGRATRTGAGGTLEADDGPVDLNKVNWDAIPALLRKADTELGVPHPTTHYIIVSLGIISNEPSIRVYASDEYGGGYLSADFQGTVQELHKRS